MSTAASANSVRGDPGHLPRAVAAGGEHLGRGVQDRLPPLPGGQPGTPRPLHSRPPPVDPGKPGLVATKHRAANSHAGTAHVNPTIYQPTDPERQRLTRPRAIPLEVGRPIRRAASAHRPPSPTG